MKVMGVNLSHDGSVCVLDKGKLVFYQEEERITHKKHTTGALNSFARAMARHDPDHIVFVGAFPYELDVKQVFSSLMLASGNYKHFTDKKKYQLHNFRDHHLAHAQLALTNSGFNDAGVLVVDGAGQAFISHHYLYRESETIFSADKGNLKVEHKYLISQLAGVEYLMEANELVDMPYFSRCSESLPQKYPYTIYPSKLSLGKMFSLAGIKIFNSYHNAGKVMGLSAYGNDIPSHPRAWVDGVANENIFNHPLSNEDLAYRVQTDSLQVSIDLIKQTIEKSGSKNICLSGGYFLNCVNNYKYLKAFPEINFYVEPNSSDSGTAIGAAMRVYKELTGEDPDPISTLYLGEDASYLIRPDHIDMMQDTTPSDVAKLLSERNVVAIYQGKEESGPRALGNRSILYDPRDPDGRDVVNSIKKREYFRPFAGTVLEEYVHDWFDMATLGSSPHMMYAVECWKDKRGLVPALQHNDGTSRVQTISADQNKNYYKLIEEFYKITGVPMVLNTSFNLAGDTLVSDLDDAIRTCLESGIKYLYLPELEKLLHVTKM
jgi:carbamoyltransferase